MGRSEPGQVRALQSLSLICFFDQWLSLRLEPNLVLLGSCKILRHDLISWDSSPRANIR